MKILSIDAFVRKINESENKPLFISKSFERVILNAINKTAPFSIDEDDAIKRSKNNPIYSELLNTNIPERLSQRDIEALRKLILEDIKYSFSEYVENDYDKGNNESGDLDEWHDYYSDTLEWGNDYYEKVGLIHFKNGIIEPYIKNIPNKQPNVRGEHKLFVNVSYYENDVNNTDFEIKGGIDEIELILTEYYDNPPESDEYYDNHKSYESDEYYDNNVKYRS